MRRARGLLLGSAAALGLLALALALCAPALAAPPPSGDWVVSGVESYADQVIVLANNSTAGGNLTVLAGGDLLLDNVTLVLPFQSLVDVEGRARVQNSTVEGETWGLLIRGEGRFTGDTLLNATFGGTVVESNNTTLDHVVWNCTGNSAGTIHIRRPIDFSNNTMLQECLVAYELAPLSADLKVEIGWDTFVDAGGGTQIDFGTAAHTGHVVFDLHDLWVNGGGWTVEIEAASANTSYLIHDSAFANTSAATIRSDAFDGYLHIWNASFVSVYRAFRMDAVPGDNIVAFADNVTVSGTGDSILADDMTWVIRNSTINSPNPQYAAGANGHIRIFDTADNAFASATPDTGGSIEHFVTLNMGVPTWQNAVPITGDLLTLRDALNAPGFVIDPSTWTPSEIVWWGMYPGGVNVDHRILKPTVEDAGTSFTCSPVSFFVSPGMPRVDVACTDDAPPRFSAITPAFPRIQNVSQFAGAARVDEAGSGLTTVEFSFDGSAYSPVTFAAGDAHNFTFLQAGLPDGVYHLWLRAYDRTANVGLVTVGPLTVDTVPPAILGLGVPSVLALTSYMIVGTTEPNATVTVVHAGGFTNTTRADAAGLFSLGVALDEGQNIYTVTARDAAGNTFSVVQTTHVDTMAPTLSVLIDGNSGTTAFARNASVRVEGFSEASALVSVNGAAASRAGEAFSLDLALARGRTNVTVTATDLAGNTASWVGAVFFDDVAPTLSATLNGAALLDGTTLATRASLAAIAGSVADNDTGVASLFVNGRAVTPDGAGAFSLALSLVEGENALFITASDRASNAASLRVTIARDTTAPTVSAWVEADASPVLEVAGVATTRGATVRLQVAVSEDGTATFAGASHAVVAGQNEFVLTLAEGQNSFTVVVTDDAGNAAPAVPIAVLRTGTPPPLTLSQPADGTTVDGATVVVAGHADPLSTVTVNGVNVTVLSTGEFSALVALSPGSNTVSIEVFDALGNTNTTSRTVVSNVAPATAAPSGGSLDLVGAVVFLAVGLAAGVLATRLRSRGAKARGDAAAPDGPEPLQGPGPGPAAPHAPPKSKGPKGPRGPQPPP